MRRQLIGFIFRHPQSGIGLLEPAVLIYDDGTNEEVPLSHPEVRRHWLWLANFRRFLANPGTDSTPGNYPALGFKIENGAA